MRCGRRNCLTLVVDDHLMRPMHPKVEISMQKLDLDLKESMGLRQPSLLNLSKYFQHRCKFIECGGPLPTADARFGIGNYCFTNFPEQLRHIARKALRITNFKAKRRRRFKLCLRHHGQTSQTELDVRRSARPVIDPPADRPRFATLRWCAPACKKIKFLSQGRSARRAQHALLEVAGRAR